MNQERLDLYSDYLCATFGKATATGLAAILDDSVSHDAITRFLAGPELTSRDLWRQVKPMTGCSSLMTPYKPNPIWPKTT